MGWVSRSYSSVRNSWYNNNNIRHCKCLYMFDGIYLHRLNLLHFILGYWSCSRNARRRYIYMQLCPHRGPLTLCIGVLWILRYMDLHYSHLNITSHFVSCKTNWLNSNMRSRLLYGVSCWNTLRVVPRTTLTHLCCFIWVKINVSMHDSPGFCFYH